MNGLNNLVVQGKVLYLVRILVSDDTTPVLIIDLGSIGHSSLGCIKG